MKIISWNVNGIRACSKKGLKSFLQKENPDIFCVQETKAHQSQVEPDIQNLDHKVALWAEAKKRGYSGVATFTNQELVSSSIGLGIQEYDSEGRVVITDHGNFKLFNIYFPNGGSGEERHNFKQKFLADLVDYLVPMIKRGEPIVVVGDYNVAHKEIDVYDPVRLSKESGFLPEERAWFSSFLELGFIDTYRYFNPQKANKYSWWSYRELARISNRGWRIDYICITKNLEKNLVAADIMDSVEGSDHCPVYAELRF